MPNSTLIPDAAIFWSLARQVLDYGADKAETYRLLAEGVDFGTITKTDFLEHLYKPREEELAIEKRLAHRLLNSTSLLALASGRGCGKTSLLIKAAALLDDSQREKGHGVDIAYINMRRLYDRHNLFSLQDQDAPLRFQQVLEETVRDSLFPEISDERTLAAWLLAGGPDHSEQFDRLLLSDLRDIASSIQVRGEVSDLPTRKKRWETLAKRFQEDGPLFLDAKRLLEPKLRVAHSVVARGFIGGISKVILLYDNIDRIPNHTHRGLLLQVADNQQTALGTLATICIAIRTENLLGSWQAEPRGSFVDLFLPNNVSYPGLILPKASGSFLSDILEARYSFAQRRFTERRQNSPFLPPDTVIHKVIVDQFSACSMHDLTNESVRAACRLYVEFMRYLYQLSADNTIDFRTKFHKERDINYAETLFYIWLRAYGHVADIHLYDLFDEDESARDGGTRASPHHFILTAIENLSNETGSESFPRNMPDIGRVFRRMSYLGFSEEECRRALHEMAAGTGDATTGTIEIHCPGFEGGLLPLNALTSSVRVRLTLLGKRLVGEVFSKVGYSWSLAYSALHRDDNAADQAYFRHSTLERVSILLGYIEDLAAKHFNFMAGVRDQWPTTPEGQWLDVYRRYFGVGNRLQIERIYTEAAKFFNGPLRPYGLSRLFDDFGGIYQVALSRLLERKDFSEDFKTDVCKLKERIEKLAKRSKD
jgi:hypothetical protein